MDALYTILNIRPPTSNTFDKSQAAFLAARKIDVGVLYFCTSICLALQIPLTYVSPGNDLESQVCRVGQLAVLLRSLCYNYRLW